MQAVNSPVQRFASDLGLIGMCSFAEGCDWDTSYPVAFIHDAVVAYAREDVVDQEARRLKECMSSQPLEEMFGIRPPLRIEADISIGIDLASMEEVDL